jgi:GAF domain-containing protein
MAEIATQRLDGYRRLVDIARDLASTLDLDVLLYRIVLAAAEITEAEAGSILLYDGTARRLHFQVATNIDQPTMRGLIVPLEGSIAGWIVTNRKPVRTTEAHNDPRHRTNNGFPYPLVAGGAFNHQGKSGRSVGSAE